MYGLYDFADYAAEWIYNLGTTVTVFLDTEILGTNLFMVLLGAGMFIYLASVVAKWIIDFFP